MNKFETDFNGLPRGLMQAKAWDVRGHDLVLDSPGASAGAQVQEMELVRLLRIVWAHRFLVAAFTAACAAAGLGIALLQTPMYRSRGTVELLGINQNFLNQREIDPNSSSGASGGDAYVGTEIELLRSEALIKRVVEKLGLVNNTAGSSKGGLFHLHKPILTEDAMVARVLANLRVEQVKSSSLLEITYTDSNPKIAADVVNALVEEAVQTNMDDRWNLGARVGTLLSKQVGLLRKRMEDAANELQAYSRESGLLYTGEKTNVAETHLGELESELAQAQNDRIQKESQYKLAQAADPESLPQVLDNGPLREYTMRLSDLNRQYADLLATRTPANAKVVQVKAQIDELKKTIESERTNILRRIANEYNTAKQRESMLTAAYHSQTSIVSDQSGKAVRYNTLKREMETTRDLYEAMLKRVNDAEMVSAIRSSDIRLVDAALPPAKPHSPNKPLMAAIGTISGLLLGFTAVFVREQRDRTIQEPGVSSSLLNLTELGVIPSARSNGPRLLANGRKRDSVDSWSDSTALSTRNGGAGNSYSLLKDSFRGVVNSILFAETEHDSMQVLIVSSPNAGEGKTTSVCNLGVAFAEIGRRVLLIDADFRKPRLHEVFSVSNESGLLNLLSDADTRRPGDIEQHMRKTNVPGLSVLTAGSTSVPLPTLLHSDRLNKLLGRLRTQYDLILIDSAPLLLVPESRILARSTDGLVLVLRAGVTTPGLALAARRRAIEDRTPLIGTILNDWKPDAAHYYPYYSDVSA